MAQSRKTSSSVAKSPATKNGAQTSTANRASASVAASENSLQLSVGELNILTVFRKYLMTPGRMLCLNNTDIGTMKRSLDKLIAAGLLIPEDFKGSYSLTRSGFNAMKELN